VRTIDGRQVELGISWSGTVIQGAKNRKNTRNKTFSCSVVRVWNTGEKLEWILVSSIPVATEEQAWEKVDWYRCRWMIPRLRKPPAMPE
jgi:hypothetical protein